MEDGFVAPVESQICLSKDGIDVGIDEKRSQVKLLPGEGIAHRDLDLGGCMGHLAIDLCQYSRIHRISTI